MNGGEYKRLDFIHQSCQISLGFERCGRVSITFFIHFSWLGTNMKPSLWFYPACVVTALATNLVMKLHVGLKQINP